MNDTQASSVLDTWDQPATFERYVADNDVGEITRYNMRVAWKCSVRMHHKNGWQFGLKSMQALAEALSSGYSPNSQDRYMRYARHYYMWLRTHGAPLPEYRVRYARRFHLPQRDPFTPEEIEFIYQKWEASVEGARLWRNRWLLPMFVIGYYCGLRTSDICLLLKTDVDMDNQVIRRVTRKTCRSSGRATEIPFGDRVRLVLEENMAMSKNEYCFPRLAACYLDCPVNVNLHFNSVLRWTGLRKMWKNQGLEKEFKSPHCLRYGLITRLLERGVTAETIASITGQHPSTVMTYSRLGLETKRKAMGEEIC